MRARRVFMVAMALLVTAFAIGQTGPGQAPNEPLPSVRDAPATITFEPWKLIERTEETDEYVAEFPSPLPIGDPANRTVQLRTLVPRTFAGADLERMPLVLVLHYLGARDLRVERSLASELNSRGIAAAIMTLPYHLSRTPPGSRSGDLAIRPSPQALRETMTQATLDMRRSLAFLRQQEPFQGQPIGIAGISLGAIVAALGYSVEPEVQSAAFLLGGADLARIVFDSSRLGGVRDALRAKGVSESRLRSELVSVEPLTYLTERPEGATLVVRGTYDTVIPRESSRELIAALGTPTVIDIDTGHYGGIFVQRRLNRELATFFARRLRGEAYVPPRNFAAPTVRIGVGAFAPSGIDLAVGLDVYRFDRRGDSTLSVLLTPRGPLAFLGTQVGTNMKLGVAFGTRRAGVGLLWSVVL